MSQDTSRSTTPTITAVLIHQRLIKKHKALFKNTGFYSRSSINFRLPYCLEYDSNRFNILDSSKYIKSCEVTIKFLKFYQKMIQQGFKQGCVSFSFNCNGVRLRSNLNLVEIGRIYNTDFYGIPWLIKDLRRRIKEAKERKNLRSFRTYLYADRVGYFLYEESERFDGLIESPSSGYYRYISGWDRSVF